MGGMCGIIAGPDTEPNRGEDPEFQRPFRAVRARSGSEEQARAGVEPRVAAGAWGGAGHRPVVFLRAVNRESGVAVLVHGRWACGDGDGGAHVCGCGAFAARVAAVQAGVRVEGVAGCWVWEARVGRTCHRFSLPAIVEGVLV